MKEMSLEVSLGKPSDEALLGGSDGNRDRQSLRFSRMPSGPLAGFTRQPLLFRENASFHMFPETGSSVQGLFPKTSANSHMDRWEFCFFRLHWESFEFLQCSAGGLNSALELGSSGSGQELDILGICQGFGFRTMPGHVNIDRSVSSGQTGASASGQRWAASMQAGAQYLQDLAGGIYAGVKGEGKPEVQTPSDILTIPPIDAKRVLPQGKPRMARGIEGTKESFGACAADSDDLDVAFGMGLEKSLHGNEQTHVHVLVVHLQYVEDIHLAVAILNGRKHSQFISFGS
ncbi:hypothetical protein MJG53_017966 [Ovis ammon polii x Ovis aries]|uniref:Uncharacterized protein n=1 Tax=Ovis ammon polii x Ovis aries TaxID=2918886 RepID=A0ACB9U5U6_9CETA|nr:hypothetical protein MJG53_017966 [Ovis ammon polii x Ovis aries]